MKYLLTLLTNYRNRRLYNKSIALFASHPNYAYAARAELRKLFHTTPPPPHRPVPHPLEPGITGMYD